MGPVAKNKPAPPLGFYFWIKHSSSAQCILCQVKKGGKKFDLAVASGKSHLFLFSFINIKRGKSQYHSTMGPVTKNEPGP
jgi:hypothetical protein